MNTLCIFQTRTHTNFTAWIATADTDTSLVNCAIVKTLTNPTVAVVGEYIDLLVVITALSPPTSNIFFTKPGEEEIETGIFPSQDLQQLFL